MVLEQPGQRDGSCWVEIPTYSIEPVWTEGSHNLLDYALPRLQLQLALIFIITQSLHLGLKRFHFPRIVSEFMAGVIIGPSILGLNYKQEYALFSEEGMIYLEILSKIGYIFFMFLIGVKMDPGIVWKSGREAWILGIASFILPILISLVSSSIIDTHATANWSTVIKTVISVQTLTPFSVVACLLTDLKIINSELGRLALSSTLISDVFSTVSSTLFAHVRMSTLGWNMGNGIQAVVLTLALVLTILLVLRPIMLWIIKRTPEGKPVDGVHIAFILLVVMFLAVFSNYVGLQYQFGPFILGLCVPVGAPLGSTLVERLDTMISGLFAPLLVTYSTMQIDIFEIYDLKFQEMVWITLSASFVIKIITSLIPSLMCKMPLRDAAVLSFISSTQGNVEIALYLTNYVNQAISGQALASGIVSVVLMAIASNHLVRSTNDSWRKYGGRQKRDIQNALHNEEFRILVCIFRPEDASAAMKLVEISNPRKESPIAAYALNLLELVGQTQPIFINHKLGQKVPSGGSRSQKLINIFSTWAMRNSGLVTAQVFTSVSLPKFMHHDICFLAFDKLASLLILPFHRKWNLQGKMVSDSTSLRQMNKHVLDMAPCSVGILIDRRKLEKSASPVYKVAAVFIGGDDDREALAYVKRMAQSAGEEVQVTVVRIGSVNDMVEYDDWESIRDKEVLKFVRILSSQQKNLLYREEWVTDGCGTASLIRSMEDKFDLIVVGRRHKENLAVLSGLNEWCELPELGPIGDTLALPEIGKPVSVLVIQQQLSTH